MSVRVINDSYQICREKYPYLQLLQEGNQGFLYWMELLTIVMETNSFLLEVSYK